jgi:hypothetical protein
VHRRKTGVGEILLLHAENKLSALWFGMPVLLPTQVKGVIPNFHSTLYLFLTTLQQVSGYNPILDVTSVHSTGYPWVLQFREAHMSGSQVLKKKFNLNFTK